jgi:hypothetical protein
MNLLIGVLLKLRVRWLAVLLVGERRVRELEHQTFFE